MKKNKAALHADANATAAGEDDEQGTTTDPAASSLMPRVRLDGTYVVPSMHSTA